MSIIKLEMKEIREELQEIQDLYIEYNLNKVYITNGILDAIAHLVTKFEGVEYKCHKIYTPGITYLTLMEECYYDFIPKSFVSSVCLEKAYKIFSEIFIKADEDGFFDVKPFLNYPYLKRFFKVLNQLQKEKGSFSVDRVLPDMVEQDMIDESVDSVLGLDENKQKVNKKR